ncbi:MAG: oligosaccharide flippase family protein [Candidatus Methylomirabilales bacterium]
MGREEGREGMGSRVVRNIFSSWGRYGVITAIRLFLTPLFIHKLGDTEYGVWILILSVIGYMELFNLGLNTANVRYLARYFEQKDDRAANEIFNCGLFIFTVLGGAVVIATLIVSVFVWEIFGFVGGSVRYKLVFMIAGVSLGLEFIYYAFSTVLSARQRYVEANIILTCVFIVRSCAAVALLLSGFGLVGVVINQAVFNVVKGIIMSVCALRSTRSLRVDSHYISQKGIQTILNFSWYIFLINVCRKISVYGGVVIIGLVMSPSSITYFAVANNLVRYLQDFIAAIPNVLIPRFSQLHAANRDDKILEYYLSFTRITLMISIPIVCVFVLYGSRLIALWIGEGYGVRAGPILGVLSVGALCQLSQSTAHSVLKATGRHKELSYFVILESVAIVVLSWLMVRRYGLIGLAWGQAISMAFFNLSIVPIYACVKLKMDIVEYYGRYMLSNAVGVVPLLVVYYLVGSSGIESVAVFGILIAGMVVAFVGFSYVFGLGMKEREMLASVVRLR